ncbi:hypothetical protein TNCV_2694611 [Trichonephila clavipes]|nr:hypothetical protein TNCV_2694611 [Trichonephila clavipes]
MKGNEVIEPSSSPWASPIVLVRKKDGSTRFCVDNCRLNDVTNKDSYSLPRIDDTLQTLAGSIWFSTPDLKSGYWQLELHPDDKEKAAFTTGQGLWQFKFMPSGLCNDLQHSRALWKQSSEDFHASHESIGTALSQDIDGQERVIAYFSKCLSKQVRNYCITRKELLAIVKAVEHFPPYLYGRRFLLRTDHTSLTWLLNFKNPEGQKARWIQRLQEYDVEIHHRKGSAHRYAEALSRRPCPKCGKYC